MSTVLQFAKEYSSSGWEMVPLPFRQKGARLKDWPIKSSLDADQLGMWFPATGQQNIGIRTGARSRLIVLDVDEQKGGGTSFARLINDHQPLPLTAKVNTGQGYHLYFRMPDGCPPLKDHAPIAGYEHLDFKAHGYVVAPPSVHPNGKEYSWENRLPVADAPQWLIDLVVKVEKTSGKRPAQTGQVAEGGRNTAMFKLASRMQAQGYNEELILAAVRAENELRNNPPLPDDEISAIVHGVANRYALGDIHPATDLGNARRLVDLADGTIRYEPKSKQWLQWDGRRWSFDEDGAIVRLAKQVGENLLTAAKLINDPDTQKSRTGFANKSQSSARIMAMIELAKSEPAIPIQFGELDLHGDRLNVANGMINLQTGELLPHDPSQFHTQLIDVEYHPDALCPNFERFVSEVLNGDGALVRYMQSAFGYAATGRTEEQCFFLLHGEGSNGKSTLLNSVRAVLGSYSKNTPTDTFLTKAAGGATTDLMRLAGARFVTASEANTGSQLADSLLKQVTGDEPMTARFLFRDFVEFKPQFKLFLGTNHLPRFSGADPAMFRRIRTIPFDRVFSEAEQDHRLPALLESEKPGILAWIIRGAIEWYSNGLQTPPAVAEANAQYRSEMDVIGQFLDEQCEVSSDAEAPARSLWKAFEYHAGHNGRHQENPTSFGRALTRRGFQPIKRNGNVVRRGIRLRQAA